MKVYVAGDMLTKASQLLRAKERDELTGLGHDVHAPQDDKEINDKANVKQEGLAERIVNNDTKAIMDADTVIMDVLGTSQGTLVELGQLKGMLDVAGEIDNILDDFRTGSKSNEDVFERIEEFVDKIIYRKFYAQSTDIRRQNTKPQSGDRREYALNQYVYGTVLDLTEGKGFMEFEEILEELR